MLYVKHEIDLQKSYFERSRVLSVVLGLCLMFNVWGGIADNPNKYTEFRLFQSLLNIPYIILQVFNNFTKGKLFKA